MTPMRCAKEVASYLQKKFNSIGYVATDERADGKPMHVYAGFLPRAMSEKDKAPQETSNITYVNGKIVLTDELDSAILKNFKVCGSKKIFQEDIDDTTTEYDNIRYNVNVPGVE